MSAFHCSSSVQLWMKTHKDKPQGEKANIASVSPWFETIICIFRSTICHQGMNFNSDEWRRKKKKKNFSPICPRFDRLKPPSRWGSHGGLSSLISSLSLQISTLMPPVSVFPRFSISSPPRTQAKGERNKSLRSPYYAASRRVRTSARGEIHHMLTWTS